MQRRLKSMTSHQLKLKKKVKKKQKHDAHETESVIKRRE